MADGAVPIFRSRGPHPPNPPLAKPLPTRYDSTQTSIPIMKKLVFLALTFAVFVPGLHAQDEIDPIPEDPAAKQDLAPWQRDFSNLPQEERVRFMAHLNKSRELFQQKRVFETIDELHKAREIFPDSPDVENMLGACQVEFRAFEKAREHFERADELSPDNPNVLFNLGELQFVTKKWAAAEKTFREVIDKLDQENAGQQQMSRLIEFKIMLCQMKQGEIEEARQLAEKYDFLDDSPFHYYAVAALAFDAGDEVKAEASLARARRVFRNPATLAPWQDTLMEFGYIKSFYGGELLEEE